MMYTYQWTSGMYAELVGLTRDTETGLIRLIWKCYALATVYGYIEMQQRPGTVMFDVVRAERKDSASWIPGHIDELVMHATKHFADSKPQTEFFKRGPGTRVETEEAEWLV